MKHIKITTLLVVTVSMFASCDFLNTSESTYYDRSELLYDPSKVTQLCTEVYSYLPNGLEGIGGAMHDAATDDAIHINNVLSMEVGRPTMSLMMFLPITTRQFTTQTSIWRTVWALLLRIGNIQMASKIPIQAISITSMK